MNNKRGLSDVVTTVLIILLVLAAVVIIWAFVRPAIQSGAGKVSGGCVELDLKVISCNSNVAVIEDPGHCEGAVCTVADGATDCGGGTCDVGTLTCNNDGSCTTDTCGAGSDETCEEYTPASTAGTKVVVERGADNVDLNKVVVIYDELNSDGTTGDTKTQDAGDLEELGRMTVSIGLETVKATVSGEIITEAGEVILCDPTALRVDCI